LILINHEITYDTGILCKGTYATVVPPFKGKGGSAPIMHPCFRVPGYELNDWLIEANVWLALSFDCQRKCHKFNTAEQATRDQSASFNQAKYFFWACK